jgi:hypothetical protein
LAVLGHPCRLWQGGQKSPLTTYKLEALATPDVFPTIDWPEIFSVPATPLLEALAETYQHPRYSKVVLET